jgi:hypothetical protein
MRKSLNRFRLVALRSSLDRPTSSEILNKREIGAE